MDFSFSEDEDLLQWAIKDFADREVAPKTPDQLKASFRSIVRAMGQLGYLSFRVPDDYGGNSCNLDSLVLLAEGFARVSVPLAHFVATTYQLTLSLARYGTEATKQTWLAPLLGGERLGALAATESAAGVDFGAGLSQAERDGQGYAVTGTKAPVSFGLEADVALTFAGGHAFVVPLDLPGIERSPWRGSGLALAAPAALTFRRVAVPSDALLSREGDGARIHREVGVGSDFRRVITALIALGAAQTALKSAVRYGKERQAFGQPIGKFEGVSEKIAEDATLVEAGRWLCYRALFLMDREKPAAKEAAMCGWWCPRVAYKTLQDTLLTHGHAGFSDDYPFEQMWRDIVGLELISGTEAMLKLAISRELSGRAGVPDPVYPSLELP
ncbi:MAG: acyl-CoA dehydrogenase family protein [Deltaproteobacteria bacterium]|nr:acyl-CoA dehydrogenase family protein [Deltaproteobacteria bacterium]